VPSIQQQPASVTVAPGTSAVYTVTASGPSPLDYQWRKNSVTLSGATGATLTLSNVQAADAGTYDVEVSNVIGSVFSEAVFLTVHVAPTISEQPEGRTVVVGGIATLGVVVTGVPTPSYQWRKNGEPIAGATGAEFVFGEVSLADAGNYDVVVTNPVGAETSLVAQISVVQLEGTHALQGSGYRPGETLTITNTITYAGSLVGFGWTVVPPETIDGQPWRFETSDEGAGQVAPLAGDTELFEWAWTSTPASPFEFSYSLNVPANVTGDQSFVALLQTRIDGEEVKTMVSPDPLVVPQAPSTHDADTNQDNKLSLGELLRVIELYNVRFGTVRTGRYQVKEGSVDGFDTDAATAGGTANNLSRHHSSDTNRDAELSLGELLRVIELYNFREGTRRTGGYHAEVGTDDGFATGPEL